ncbi:MAG: gamma-glutamyl kinase [Pseudomonadota bacterium]
MDVVISKMPSAKHTPLRKYERHLKRYLEGLAGGPMETVCLFREPVDWLNSWWRYRSRDDIPKPANSTRELDFDSFVQRYLDDATPPANLGRQSRFISGSDGNPGVDHLFRYERLNDLLVFVAARMKTVVSLEHLNVSPTAHRNDTLSACTRTRLQEELATDFEIYESLGS